MKEKGFGALCRMCARSAAPPLPFVRPIHSRGARGSAHIFLSTQERQSFHFDTRGHRPAQTVAQIQHPSRAPGPPYHSHPPGRAAYRLAPPGRLKRVLKAHLHLGFILPALLHPGFFLASVVVRALRPTGQFPLQSPQKSSVYHGRADGCGARDMFGARECISRLNNSRDHVSGTPGRQ